MRPLKNLGTSLRISFWMGVPQGLTSLAKCEADLIFNLTESFAGDDTKEMHVAAYLDLLGLRYTGAGPHASFLAQDKAIAKKMFAFHGIRTPYFATSYRGTIEHAHDIAFPLIVKPLAEDGSIGINSNAVVTSVKELMERVQYIQDEFDSPAIIEEYIEGREIYAAILGQLRICASAAAGRTRLLEASQRHTKDRQLRCKVRERCRGVQADQIEHCRRPG